jgi:VWFA-related protein
MANIFSTSVLSLAVAGALITGTPTPSLSAGTATQARTRTVYVSVTDKKGEPVTDLQGTEFEVKEGGKTQQVVSAQMATTPLRVAVLVSDAGTGAFQAGLAHFMQSLLGHAEFALTSVIVQPEKILDYTADASTLSAAVRRLGPRGRQRGAQLMEAIQEATKNVSAEGKRPVIVVLRVGAEDATSIPADDVREQLRKSGAVLYVLSTVGAQRQAPSQARAGISSEQAQLRDDEVNDGALNLGQVLGDGSKESGGRHDQVVSTSLVEAMKQVAGELLQQYEITYILPEGMKPSDRISVSSKRKGVTVRAPTRRGV